MPGGPGMLGGLGGRGVEIDGPEMPYGEIEGPLTKGIPGGRQPEPRATRQHAKMK